MMRMIQRNVVTTSLLLVSVLALFWQPPVAAAQEDVAPDQVQLAPDALFSYEGVLTFLEPGSGYFAEIHFKYGEDDWHFMGRRVAFAVAPGLRVVEPLRLTPASPMAGEGVTARFALRNDGSGRFVLVIVTTAETLAGRYTVTSTVAAARPADFYLTRGAAVVQEGAGGTQVTVPPNTAPGKSLYLPAVWRQSRRSQVEVARHSPGCWTVLT